MELFINVWNNWVTQQKISFILLYGGCLILLLLGVYLATKNKRFVLYTFVSLLSSALITVLVLVLVHIIFSVTITYIFMLTPIIVLFINIISLGTELGYYTANRKTKDFGIVSMRQEMIRDSLQITVFVLLLFTSFSVFITGSLFVFVVVTGSICLVIPWVNCGLTYWLLKKDA